jgi:serine/threonine protein kinase
MMKREMLGSNCGSPTYCAPEIFLGKKYIGPEVDMWSLGVILYSMVTGNCPWPGNTLQEQATNTINGRYYPITSHVSQECQELVRRILTVEPKDRPTLAEIQRHPWVNDGYTLLPVADMSGKKKAPKGLDMEVVAQLEQFGFDKAEIVDDILNYKTIKQTFVLYRLLLEQKSKQEDIKNYHPPSKERRANRNSWAGPKTESDLVAIATGVLPTDSTANPVAKSGSGLSPPGSPMQAGKAKAILDKLFKKKDKDNSPGSSPTLGRKAPKLVVTKSCMEIQQEVEGVLTGRNISWKMKGHFKYSCKFETASHEKIKFMLEIYQETGKGIKFKRTNGNVLEYASLVKDICAELLI